MTSYKEITAQIETLQKQAIHLRQTEMATTIAHIKTQMREYGITVADLGVGTTKKNGTKGKEPVAAKYRDTASGVTWSGRGKPPKWIAGKERAAFLIK